MMHNNTEGPHIVFFGSEGISLTVLERMMGAGFVPGLIVAQPDKPKGRKMIPTPPEIITWAKEHDIPTIQPESLKKETPEQLQTTPNGELWDCLVVVSYGNIIPQNILDLPSRGALNIHPSLLPELRGPSPIVTAILQDKKETGVTLMQLDTEMDHGPIVAQAKVNLEDWPVAAPILEDMLGSIGADLLIENLIPWINGDISAEEQDHDRATYCSFVHKKDAEINLDDDPYQNYLKIKAYEGWPQAYFFITHNNKQTRVKILDAQYQNDTLTITRVVPEGKKEMDYEAFMRGIR